MSLTVLTVFAFSAGIFFACVFARVFGHKSWQEACDSWQEAYEAKEELCVDLRKRCERAEKQEDYWYNKYDQQRKQKQGKEEWWKTGEPPPWENEEDRA